jgi:hypothetical protein
MAVFCPRCGAESEEGSRYCASCGSELPRLAGGAGAERAAPAGFRQWLGRVVGSSRRARLLTVGTALALAVFAVAFIALRPSDEGAAPYDAYARSLDAACLRHKDEIATAQRVALRSGGFGSVSRYADSLVAIVGEWREELESKPPPADRADAVGELSPALLEVEIEAGSLARAARESDRRGVATDAARVDAASEKVEAALSPVGLERCAGLAFAREPANGR